MEVEWRPAGRGRHTICCCTPAPCFLKDRVRFSPLRNFAKSGAALGASCFLFFSSGFSSGTSSFSSSGSAGFTSSSGWAALFRCACLRAHGPYGGTDPQGAADGPLRRGGGGGGVASLPKSVGGVGQAGGSPLISHYEMWRRRRKLLGLKMMKKNCTESQTNVTVPEPLGALTPQMPLVLKSWDPGYL